MDLQLGQGIDLLSVCVESTIERQLHIVLIG